MTFSLGIYVPKPSCQIQFKVAVPLAILFSMWKFMLSARHVSNISTQQNEVSSMCLVAEALHLALMLCFCKHHPEHIICFSIWPNNL